MKTTTEEKPLENLENEIVEYIINTPHNANPNVVRSMVRAAADNVSGTGTDVETMCTAIIERGDAQVTKLPDAVTKIGSYAFYNYTKLTSISLPNSITSIGDYAFYGCTNLVSISLPNSITSIGRSAFYGCTKLALTSLPSSITSIGDHAFSQCLGLTELTFKSTPTTIDSRVFSSCTNLKTINVPWAEGAVKNAPWGATNATINYNYRGG